MKFQYATANSRLLLSAIICGGIALRFWRLGNPLFFSDESFSWWLCTYPIHEMIERVAQDTHPVLHFLAQKIWMSFAGVEPARLRSLSALCSVASIPVAYAICSNVAELSTTKPKASRFGPLLAAGLVAIHTVQLDAARTARMYSLGVLLGGLSTLLLLRALADTRWRAGSWVRYAVISSLFLHTHNFAMFTIAAQWLCIAGKIGSTWTQEPEKRRALSKGLLLACAITTVLYGPWIGAFATQASRVKEDFWIREARGSHLYRTISEWTVGQAHGTPIVALFCTLSVGACLVWSYRRANLGAVLLSLQTVVPWVATLGVSTLGGRSILQVRYLVFSNYSWILLVACVIASFTFVQIRGIVAWNLIALVGLGTKDYLSRIPDHPPSIVDAVADMKERFHNGDVIATPSPGRLNVVRYYMARAKLDVESLRCPIPQKIGHINHLSSLSETNRLLTLDPDEIGDRIWNVNGTLEFDSNWHCEYQELFAPGQKTFPLGLSVQLYTRKKPIREH